jgi:acetyl-CoA carboxylase biotin carboxylase subunit
MGNKLAAREAARRSGVPLVPGSDQIRAFEDAHGIAEAIGYPVLFKAAAGGGGRGIRIVHAEPELEAAFRGASAEAAAAFGDPTLYLERYVTTGRHIEVQVIGDSAGTVLHLGERDCSLQRRYQKVLEEAPAAAVPEHAREAIRASAVLLARAIGYVNAGTVEFLYDEERDEHYFLEMNTRIQVEHPVTEMITGLDLVQLQLQVAAGRPLPLSQEQVTFGGHAIECRINAEAPERGFAPSPGRITRWQPPQGPGVRLDSHIYEGYVVPPFYDSLLGKLVVHGRDRAEALARTRAALDGFGVEGVATTIPFHRWLLDQPDVVAGRFSTRWLEGRLSEFTG